MPFPAGKTSLASPDILVSRPREIESPEDVFFTRAVAVQHVRYSPVQTRRQQATMQSNR